MGICIGMVMRLGFFGLICWFWENSLHCTGCPCGCYRTSRWSRRRCARGCTGTCIARSARTVQGRSRRPRSRTTKSIAPTTTPTCAWLAARVYLTAAMSSVGPRAQHWSALHWSVTSTRLFTRPSRAESAQHRTTCNRDCAGKDTEPP